MKTTPFYDRTSVLNATGLWGHWAGFLSATQYHHSEKFEYFAVRTSAGVYDTSPLNKYRINGPDAEKFLCGVLARDIRTCRPGQAQYTIWCDEEGYVVEDGVILRQSENEFLLTAAEPNMAYFQDQIGYDNVEIEDVSERVASFAFQGPRTRDILAKLTPDVDALGYFGLTETKIDRTTVTVSRTGFTGGLGYELWIPADRALDVWDAVFDAGVGHHMYPFGETALLMTRIEAGLILIDADFSPSRFAWTDAQKSTPLELGMGWMFRNIETDSRAFIGRESIRREIQNGSRWHLVGLVLDWADWNRTYSGQGHVAPKDHTPLAEEILLYREGVRVGFATSHMYSPMMQRHIAIARVKPALASVGSEVDFEVAINHELHYVKAAVTKMPFYNPPHKTARG
jgi:aminomethyltransferase